MCEYCESEVTAEDIMKPQKENAIITTTGGFFPAPALISNEDIYEFSGKIELNKSKSKGKVIIKYNVKKRNKKKIKMEFTGCTPCEIRIEKVQY